MFRRLSTEIATLCAITSTALVLAAALLTRIAAIPAASAAALAGLLAYAIVRILVAQRVARGVAEIGGALSRAAEGECVEIRVKGRNEIAALASSFNLMSGRMAERDQHIARLTWQDETTGLPNMRAMEVRLAEMRDANDPATLFAVVIAIDEFARLRLTIGYAPCVKLIAAIAHRISTTYGEIFVGYAGPDRIAAVFRAESAEAAVRTATAIAAIAAQPTRLDEDRIEVSVTTGLACHADAPHVPLSLLQRAEAALDQARTTHRDASVFDEAAYDDPAATLSLMDEMLLGLERGEIFLTHEPIYDLRKRAILSAASAPHWRHPSRGFLPPDKFVQFAERTGHIRQLTEWMIDRAIADQRRAREAGRDVVLSIALPAALAASRPFAERVIRQTRRSGARLCFEITGDASALEDPHAIETMKSLRDAGVAIAIAGFGASPSSIASLRGHPARAVKIGRTFTTAIARGKPSAMLVKAIIDLAHSVGLTVTAEGVETQESFNLLQSMGADAAQGALIARAMPITEFLKFDTPPLATARPATSLKGLA
ncbi:MAG: GGDEF domain-containing phosphodiesterase [Hyphomonadaceae bacterium]|nr:GGDEF domain-containing phosphodiesterase [Hyphomonadaceae bacterium]